MSVLRVVLLFQSLPCILYLLVHLTLARGVNTVFSFCYSSVRIRFKYANVAMSTQLCYTMYNIIFLFLSSLCTSCFPRCFSHLFNQKLSPSMTVLLHSACQQRGRYEPSPGATVHGAMERFSFPQSLALADLFSYLFLPLSPPWKFHY